MTATKYRIGGLSWQVAHCAGGTVQCSFDLAVEPGQKITCFNIGRCILYHFSSPKRWSLETGIAVEGLFRLGLAGFIREEK